MQINPVRLIFQLRLLIVPPTLIHLCRLSVPLIDCSLPFLFAFKNLQVDFQLRKQSFPHQKVVTSCSKSGKLSTSLIEYWIREVLDKVTSNRFLLFVDQWSSQTDISVTKEQSCKVLVIPRRITSTRQPCDI